MLSLPKTVRLEKAYEDDILDYLNKRGDCFAWKVNNKPAYDKERGIYLKKTKYDLLGQPDITAAFAGGIVRFFEVKRPGGRQSEHQVAFESKLKKLGVHYHLVITVEDVEGILS